MLTGSNFCILGVNLYLLSAFSINGQRCLRIEWPIYCLDREKDSDLSRMQSILLVSGVQFWISFNHWINSWLEFRLVRIEWPRLQRATPKRRWIWFRMPCSNWSKNTAIGRKTNGHRYFIEFCKAGYMTGIDAIV